MNQHIRHHFDASSCELRLGREPRLTLSTLYDLGMSSGAIARFLGITPSTLERLCEVYRVGNTVRH